jgi:hypothetical protein
MSAIDLEFEPLKAEADANFKALWEMDVRFACYVVTSL